MVTGTKTTIQIYIFVMTLLVFFFAAPSARASVDWESCMDCHVRDELPEGPFYGRTITRQFILSDREGCPGLAAIARETYLFEVRLFDLERQLIRCGLHGRLEHPVTRSWNRTAAGYRRLLSHRPLDRYGFFQKMEKLHYQLDRDVFRPLYKSGQRRIFRAAFWIAGLLFSVFIFFYLLQYIRFKRMVQQRRTEWKK